MGLARRNAVFQATTLTRFPFSASQPPSRVLVCRAVTRSRIAGRRPLTTRSPRSSACFTNRKDAVLDAAPPRERPDIDYRPIVAVIAIVIFGLGLIAVLLSGSSKWKPEGVLFATSNKERAPFSSLLSIPPSPPAFVLRRL